MSHAGLSPPTPASSLVKVFKNKLSQHYSALTRPPAAFVLKERKGGELIILGKLMLQAVAIMVSLGWENSNII